MMTRPSGTELLDSIKETLRDSVPRPKFDLLIEPLTFEGILDGTIFLGVESSMLKVWIEDQYAGLILEHMKRCDGRVSSIELRVIHAPYSSLTGSSAGEERVDYMVDEVPPAAEKPTLNPRFTFDNFVVGPANSFAYSASLAVAEGPAS